MASNLLEACAPLPTYEELYERMVPILEEAQRNAPPAGLDRFAEYRTTHEIRKEYQTALQISKNLRVKTRGMKRTHRVGTAVLRILAQEMSRIGMRLTQPVDVLGSQNFKKRVVMKAQKKDRGLTRWLVRDLRERFGVDIHEQMGQAMEEYRELERGHNEYEIELRDAEDDDEWDKDEKMEEEEQLDHDFIPLTDAPDQNQPQQAPTQNLDEETAEILEAKNQHSFAEQCWALASMRDAIADWMWVQWEDCCGRISIPRGHKRPKHPYWWRKPGMINKKKQTRKQKKKAQDRLLSLIDPRLLEMDEKMDVNGGWLVEGEDPPAGFAIASTVNQIDAEVGQIEERHIEGLDPPAVPHETRSQEGRDISQRLAEQRELIQRNLMELQEDQADPDHGQDDDAVSETLRAESPRSSVGDTGEVGYLGLFPSESEMD